MIEMLLSSKEEVTGFRRRWERTMKRVRSWRWWWGRTGTNFVNWFYLLTIDGRNPRLVSQLWLHYPGQVDWLVVMPHVVHHRRMRRRVLTVWWCWW